MIHCEKSTCKYWCEDICTIDLNGRMVYVDSNGECENYEEGKCDWYEIAEKCNGECEGCSVEGCQPNKNLIKTIWYKRTVEKLEKVKLELEKRENDYGRN